MHTESCVSVPGHQETCKNVHVAIVKIIENNLSACHNTGIDKLYEMLQKWMDSNCILPQALILKKYNVEGEQLDTKSILESI